MLVYKATTAGMTVQVNPIYLDGQSDPMKRQFVFGYFVRIQNDTEGEVQLLRRHWYISDADGRMQEVEGEGVIGEQPVIPVGGAHMYNSYCVLPTFTGSMKGTYLMERERGERFRISIPRFELRAAVN